MTAPICHFPLGVDICGNVITRFHTTVIARFGFLRYTANMKGKALVGLFLALILSACPSISSLSAAASPRGEHSCCAPDGTSKRSHPAVPTSGDCCLRAPAHTVAFAITPEFHVVFIALTSVPVLSPTRRLFALDSSDSSPPLEESAVRSSSPRAPPAVPA